MRRHPHSKLRSLEIFTSYWSCLNFKSYSSWSYVAILYNCLQNANASSFSNDKFTISGNGSVTFYLAIYDHFAICSFFIEVDILLQTKAQNNGCLDSTYKPGKCHFRLSEGWRFFQNCLYAPRQLMVALRLDSVSGRIISDSDRRVPKGLRQRGNYPHSLEHVWDALMSLPLRYC